MMNDLIKISWRHTHDFTSKGMSVLQETAS